MAQPAEPLTLNEKELEIGVSTGAGNMEGDVPNDCECPDFCGEFVESLPEENKGKVIHLIHSLLQKKIDVVLPSCESILKEMEKTYGIESFIYGQILKQIVLALIKTSQTDGAIQLVEHRLRVLNKEDFITLIILGIVYDRKGDYKNAKETYQRANDSANQNSNNLQCALSLVKLATSFWNLQQPDQSRQFRDKGLRTFEQSDIKNTGGLSPEVLILLLDYYKTVAYLQRHDGDFDQCRRYYSLALDVMKKKGCSPVQEMKILSWLSSSYAQLKNSGEVDLCNQRVIQIVDEIQNNSASDSHAFQIIHVMSQIAFAYTCIHQLKEALEVYEKSLIIARKSLGDADPEVARISSSIIVLCYQTNQSLRAPNFSKIYKKSMEECQYKSDENKMKLFVREISDALNNFGFFCVLQRDYAQAEKSYKECLEINKKVYGDAHPRIAKELRSLGHMYMKWGKHDLATEMFSASLSIYEQYQPDHTDLLNAIRKELELSGKPSKSSREYASKLT